MCRISLPADSCSPYPKKTANIPENPFDFSCFFGGFHNFTAEIKMTRVMQVPESLDGLR